ncbi:rpl27A (nucleomorph) [Hemiselmis andersenii]|uniref:Rpl27A n=1 Tax=Hemiselmis andersenii TaxID=464988 RepID=A9BL25_HEMAN|nr:rpl27A [Hemiselmis andersenii]ABW98208.1 rpl27A [Hemiselmis andersenii]|mmetsp:Transcript_29695/g.69393  ORF Transcript_29695/g.69393 Transcript_29695/m.69393 type:complete len:174 (+) Transcript_29695:4290-4811(+)
MPTDQKKTRKRRGHVSCGHGRIGKHRKHPGGRGNAGGQHHHKILFDKFHSGYFGKKGMRQFHKKKPQSFFSSVNLDKISSMISKKIDIKNRVYPFFNKVIIENELFKKNIISSYEKNYLPSPYQINLSHYGFSKVLGKGKKPIFPFIIKAKNFSTTAKNKVIKSGGAVVVTNN